MVAPYVRRDYVVRPSPAGRRCSRRWPATDGGRAVEPSSGRSSRVWTG